MIASNYPAVMGPNRRFQDRERAAAQRAAEAKRAEAERKAIAEAERIVAIWNARQAGGRALWFYPTIGAAIAQRPLADVFLSGVSASRRRGSPHARRAPSCRQCSSNAPFARLEMLTEERPG